MKNDMTFLVDGTMFSPQELPTYALNMGVVFDVTEQAFRINPRYQQYGVTNVYLKMGHKMGTIYRLRQNMMANDEGEYIASLGNWVIETDCLPLLEVTNQGLIELLKHDYQNRDDWCNQDSFHGALSFIKKHSWQNCIFTLPINSH